MKLQRSNLSEVEVEGALEEPRRFQIAASREAFQILSSGLYNNKIRAIIRELSCNAYDAHVAAGRKNVPFDIHMPTALEPWFTIRDYGTGLSHEDIIELYTTYFASNKTSSNLFVGALGLGSKSPFCYTEGFTVVSYFNKKKFIYANFIDKDGFPNITLQSEDETDEENGLEVQFPVHKQDVWEFENQAREALEFFNPKPKLNISVRIKEQQYSMKSPRWGIRTTGNYDGPRAIQGMVAYAIGNIDKSRLSADVQNLIDMPIDLFFELGELSPAASRETLSNDERTIDNIIKCFAEITDGVAAEVKLKLDACDTWWKARIEIHNLAVTGKLGPIINKLFNAGKFDGKYVNFTLSHDDLKFKPTQHPNVKLIKYFLSYGGSLKSDVMEEYDDIKINERTLFITNDIPRAIERHIKVYLDEGGEHIETVYLITRVKDVSDQDFNIEAAKVLKAMHNPPHKLASEVKNITQPIIAARVSTADAEQFQRELLVFNPSADIGRKSYYDGNEQFGWSKAWSSAVKTKEEIVNILTGTEQKYYILLYRSKPQIVTMDYAEDLKDLMSNAARWTEYGIDAKTPIYGISASASDKMKREIQNNPTFKEFFTHMAETTKKLFDPTVEFKLALNLAKIEYKEYFKKLGKKGKFTKDSPFQKFCNILNLEDEAIKDKLSSLNFLIDKLNGLEIVDIKITIDIKKEWEKIVKLYPLIESLSFSNWEGKYWMSDEEKERLKRFHKAFIEYINIVDATRPLEIENQPQQLLEGETNEQLAESNENPVCA